jgi:hypothetical protein
MAAPARGATYLDVQLHLGGCGRDSERMFVLGGERGILVEVEIVQGAVM